MTCLSSSATISRGVSVAVAVAARSGREMAIMKATTTGLWNSQFLDSEVRVGINADVGGDNHRLLRDLPCRQWAVPGQRLRGTHCKRSSRSDGDNPIIGFDEVASTGEKKGRLSVGDDHHCFETPEQPVRSPVARQLHGRPLEIAAVLFELRFKAREQRKRIGGRPGEAGEDALVVEATDLAGAVFHDGVAERDLAV